ncbi:MAG: hypothetical protein AB7Q97_06310 [Gammaproteobacteria bacterium]
MLTYEDCLALSGLTEEEIEAISEHEHIPEIIALEYGHYLVEMPDGTRRIRRIILDDIDAASNSGHAERATHLRAVLKHFIATHPQHRVQPFG